MDSDEYRRRGASMISAPVRQRLITGDELLAMGDIGPCELVQGKIVPMSTTGGEHGLLEAGIARHLGNFNAEHKLGWVISGEAGVYTQRNPDTVRGMDAAYISKARHPARPKGYLEVAPELIVEIVSPNDRWRDIQDKLQGYFAIGVETAWLVDPKERTVFVYAELADLTRVTAQEILRGEGALSGFALSLTEL